MAALALAEVDGGESLESWLNKATNPINREEDWEFIMGFCDQINKELEGPQIAVRLLAHKIQSPQEKEALYALTTMEACVKNCGKRFHQEIGKFRFLNEVIKVVSPKYLGSHTSESVKKKCVELLYSWSQGLKHEPKMQEAYTMLKRQGIIKQDPTYVDKYSKTFEPPPERPKNVVFDDEDKTKLLAKLLKSKSPEDLQAANRLIKNMVKQDAERIDKMSRRTQELETVSNNISVLSEMLLHFNKDTATAAERDVMRELHDNLEKSRPNLFRLASDTDDKDNDAINEILKTNDEVMQVLIQYRKVIEGSESENGLLMSSEESGKLSSLLDLGPQNHSSSSCYSPSHSVTGRAAVSSSAAAAAAAAAAHGTHSSLLDEQLAQIAVGNKTQRDGKSDLDELGDIFSSSAAGQDTSTDIGLLDLGGASSFSFTPAYGVTALSAAAQTQQQLGQLPGGVLPAPHLAQGQTRPLGATNAAFAQNPLGGGATAAGAFSPFAAPQPAGVMATNMQQQQHPAMSVFSQPVGAVHPSSAAAGQAVSSLSTGAPGAGPGAGQPTKSGFDALDELGKSLMQQTLTTQPQQAFPVQSSPATKVPMNQMSKTMSTSAGVMGMSPIATPSSSMTASPAKAAVPTGSPAAAAAAAARLTEVQPLTSIMVPLESVQPGSAAPHTVYEKEGVKIVFHFAKNQPRPDVQVCVISVMSTNASPVKNFVFQAAVPKVMKVKLQPPSATDLPAHNPILPPAAITQVMLVANPHKEKIRLKYKVSYTIDGSSRTGVGEADQFPDPAS